MATLVSDIIDQAFIDLGVIQPGETITAAMLANAFLVLKQMYSGWSADRLMAYLIYHQAFTLVAGTSKYTVGTTGSLVATARPVAITGWQSAIGNISTGGVVMNFDEFRAKYQNLTGKRSQLAEAVAADFLFPNINIEVYPTPDTSPGTLTLDYYSPLVEFAATSTSLTLPDGYEAALHTNLALALAPQYARVGGVTPELLKAAQDAKAFIVQKNAAILGLSQAPAAA